MRLSHYSVSRARHKRPYRIAVGAMEKSRIGNGTSNEVPITFPDVARSSFETLKSCINYH
jgi:hypothetical protein